MEELAMKGFNTGDGYMGLVDGKYILFASEIGRASCRERV